MQYIFFIPVLIPIVLSLLTYLSISSIIKKEKDMSPVSFIVRPSILHLIVGIVGCVFFIGCITIMYVFPNETSSFWVALIFGIFVLIGLFVIFNYYTYHVLFNKENIIKPGLFRTKIIDYKDIKYAKLINNRNSLQCTLYLYNAENKKLLSFDDTYIGYDLAIKKLNKLKIEIIEK